MVARNARFFARSRSAVLCALLAIVACGIMEASVREYWVSPSGSDSSDGSQTHPWKTILYASQHATLGAGGTIIHVTGGTYTLGASMVTRAKGTASQRLVYKCDAANYGCVITATSNIGSLWYQLGDYVDIVGFELTGHKVDKGLQIGAFPPSTQGYAQFNRVLGNKFDHLGDTQCSAGSGVQEGYATHDLLFDHNIVDHVGFFGSCSPTSTYGTGSHGLYLSGFHNIVTNNLFSNAAGRGISVYHDSCRNVISNNTIFHNYTAGIDIGGTPDGQWGCGSSDDYNAVNNNLVVRNGWGCNIYASGSHYVVGGISIFSVGTSATHNTVNNNYLAGNFTGAGYPGCPGSNNGIIVKSGQPAPSMSGNLGTSTYGNLFVNYQDNGGGNYRLALGSPAAYAGSSGRCAVSPGITNCATPYDFVGASRLLSSTYDNGVYIY